MALPNYYTINNKAVSDAAKIGYCWYNAHKGFLTVALLREHQCVEKECKYFQKYKDAGYWKEQKKRKAKSKELRAKRKEMIKKKEYLLRYARDTLSGTKFKPLAVLYDKDKKLYTITYKGAGCIPKTVFDDIKQSCDIKSLYFKKIS